MSHLRRQDRQITDSAQIENILATGRYAIIALADGDEPYIVTLSYGYDATGSRLCFHSACTGRKISVIERNSRACATIIRDLGYSKGECAQPFESIVLTGTMRVIDEPDQARQAMRILVDHLEGPQAADEVWARNGLDDDKVFDRLSMLEFAIDGLCAKQGQ